MKKLVLVTVICAAVASSPAIYADIPLIDIPARPLSKKFLRSISNQLPYNNLRMYQIYKDTHELLSKHAVEYWIIAGTLLGAVRHQGQIPWDDDGDICIPASQSARFVSLKPLFDEIGYIIAHVPFGFCIIPKDLHDIPEHKRPWIDVFVAHEKGNKVIYARNAFYFAKDELYPLKSYQFGEIKLVGPNKANSYLSRHYGANWRTHATKYSHSTHQKEQIKLTEQDLLPAQPTGPLEDRMN